MPPLSSRLNIRNLENSNRLPANLQQSQVQGLLATFPDETESKSSSVLGLRENQNNDKELSNDALNENSDSDKSVRSSSKSSSADKSVEISPRVKDDAGDVDSVVKPQDTEDTTNNDGADKADDAPSKEADGDDGVDGEAETKWFFCKTCNQGFTRKHNMISHELIHLSVKPFICRTCGASFRRLHDLKRHDKLHTGERPFHCEKCNRRFARTDALTRHINSPHACTGKPPLKDEIDGPAENNAAVDLLQAHVSPTEEGGQTAPSATPATNHSGSGSSIFTGNQSSASSSSNIMSDSKTLQSSKTDVRPPDGSIKTQQALISTVMHASGSLSSDSLGSLSDSNGKSNYDLHRWKAYQQQRNNLGADIAKERFPYNTTTTTTTTTTTMDGTNKDKTESLSFRRQLQHQATLENRNGNYQTTSQDQHYHHHFHHHHHHDVRDKDNSQGGGLSLWGSSDRELRPDGQFRKHDDYYPKDIRNHRRERAASSDDSARYAMPFDFGPNGLMYPSNGPPHGGVMMNGPEPFRGHPGPGPGPGPGPVPGPGPGPSPGPFHYSPAPTSDGGQNTRFTNDQFHKRPKPIPVQSWPPVEMRGSALPNQRGDHPFHPQFVSMERYQDLVTYATSLQDSLSNMDLRIKLLEHGAAREESALKDANTPRKRAKTDANVPDWDIADLKRN